MEKGMKALFVFLFMILVLSGALAAEKKSKPEIKLVDNYIAVFDFEVRTRDKDISRSLADKVIHVFSESDRYKVIDRGNMNKILKEQKFQMSGCVAQECKVEAGQLLGVGKIVSGSVGIVGKTYYLTLQLIDVRTGEILKSAEDECRCEIDELLGSTRRLAKKLLSEQDEQPVTTAPKPAIVVESEAEALAKDQATAKAKVEADKIAKAKAEAEKTERAKAAQIAKAKAEEITRAKAEAEEIARTKAKAEEIARAEEIERAKAEQIAKAKAEEIAKAKAKADAIAKAKAEEIAKAKAEGKQHELKIITAAIDPAMVSLKDIAPDGRFEKLASGVVHDTQSGLEWYAGPDKNTSWGDAQNWADNLRVDGGGWCMPTMTELKGLYQKGVGSRNMTSMLETTGWWIWSVEASSDFHATSTGGAGSKAENQLCLDLDGGREYSDKRGNTPYKRVFAVRSRK